MLLLSDSFYSRRDFGAQQNVFKAIPTDR